MKVLLEVQLVLQFKVVCSLKQARRIYLLSNLKTRRFYQDKRFVLYLSQCVLNTSLGTWPALAIFTRGWSFSITSFSYICKKEYQLLPTGKYRKVPKVTTLVTFGFTCTDSSLFLSLLSEGCNFRVAETLTISGLIYL